MKVVEFIRKYARKSDKSRFEVEAGKYLPVLDTDNQLFSGFNRIDDGLEHFTLYREGRNWLSLYIPSRTAVVLQLQEENFKMKK